MDLQKSRYPLVVEIVIGLIAVAAIIYFVVASPARSDIQANTGSAGSVNTNTTKVSPVATAKIVQNINISLCLPAPKDAIVMEGDSVGFVNADAVPHKIAFDAENVYTVPAKSKIVVPLDFFGVGRRAYDCDGARHVGTIGIKTR